MALKIVGYVPGLQNTGAMWAEVGVTQPITDRHLFHPTDEGGLVLIVGGGRGTSPLRPC